MNDEKQKFSINSFLLGILFILGSYFAFTNPIETFETFALFFSVVIILYGIYQIINFFRLRKLAENRSILWMNLVAGTFAIILLLIRM